MSTAELVPLVVAVLFVLVVVGAGLAVARHRTRHQEPPAAVLPPERPRPAEPAPVRSEPVQASVPRPEPAPRPLELRPLADDARQRYAAAWDGVQGRFVDAPVLALSEADALLTRLLADRGLPSDEAHLSGALPARHTHVLEAFRAGHAIEQRNSTQRADADEVRQGMRHFTEVFQALVGDPAEQPYPRTSQKVSQRETR